MKRLPYNHRDRTLRILASNGGIITLRELRRLMEIKLENLDRILRGLEAQGRIVRTTGKLGMENISLRI
jgi:DNA-binding MarR family transcriptional regulator